MMELALMEAYRMFARRVLIVAVVLILLWPAHSAAQSPVAPGQLPLRTSFYLLWHGTPSGGARAKNSLFALWDDPGFAAARSALLASFLSQDAKQKDKPAISREEAAQYITLLDNPFLVGYVRRIESAPGVKTASTKDAADWNGTFLIYDRTGKEDLLSKAVLRLRGADTEIPKLTNLTVAGVSALKVERKTGVNYWAEFGKYAVSAQELSVFEEIINIANGKPDPASLSQSAAFTEAKPLLTGGVLEFFVNISNLKQLASDSQAPGSPAAQFKPLIDALKLDALHSVAGKLSLEGSRTRMQAALLGDAVPGSLFDVFSDGQTKPASTAFLFPDTVYYSESQLNLLGLYKVLKRAFTQASENPGQINMFDALAAAKLGMPLEDALGLTSGEFATLQTSPSLDDAQQVYFLGIRNKPETLKLSHTLMGDRISSEHSEGNTTFLKISLQPAQSKAGVAQSNFYYLAMTPGVLLGGAKAETVRNYLDQAASSASTTPKTLQALRSQFPEKVSGMTFVDFQKLDWAALKAKWIAEADKAAQSAKSSDAAKTNNLKTWLTQVDPAVFPRHLHTLAGASWKDAKGVHLDEWLE